MDQIETTLIQHLGKEWNNMDWVRSRMKFQLRNKIWNREDQIEKNFHLIKTMLPETLQKKGALLDLSCGTGIFLEIFRLIGWTVQGTEKPGHLYGPMHRVQNLPVQEYDSLRFISDPVEKRPFAENSFDLVTCIGAFNYIPTGAWLPIAQEMMRISKKAIMISFDYEFNFIALKDQIKAWPIGDLKKISTNHFKWYKKGA